MTQQDSPVFEPVIVADMPNPNAPTISAWVDRLEEVVGDVAEELQETVLIGHSVGAQAVIRYLERLPDDVSVAGALLVAGWLDVDQVWDAIRPWVETPIDNESVTGATRKIVVLLSDNDPFTSNYEVSRRRWEQEYGATVHVKKGAHHFNGATQSAVLEALLSELNP